MSTGNKNQARYPIIDSHIHLYASGHIKDLAWTSTLPPDHILNCQNSVTEYKAASKSQLNLIGYIFLETDRKSSLTEDGWTHALEEIAFLQRIKNGAPVPNEGHIPEDHSLLLAIIPWIPLPAHSDLFNRYLTKVNTPTRDPTIKGFRYLMQDKPPGTQLLPQIVPNLLTLETQGYKTFDLGIDFHSHGSSQLTESISMLESFYASSTTHSLNIVLNHFCKPDLCPGSQAAATFSAWEACIRRLARFPSTYMKLSGLFSEMAPEETRSVEGCLEVVRPYARVVFECFGATRIMFGSDWPVCNVGGPGDGAWKMWVEVVQGVLEDVGCSEEEMGMVWSGTARKVYGIGKQTVHDGVFLKSC